MLLKTGKIFLFLLALLLMTGPAQAGNCADPVATEGTVVYNIDHHVLQFCDGTDWIAVSQGIGGGGASGTVTVVAQNCATAFCSAVCPAGTAVIYAMGRHGHANNLSDDWDSGWACADARSWMGQCLGASSCTLNTGCASSSMYIICQ